MKHSTRDREFLNTLERILASNFHRDDFGVREFAKLLHMSRSQLHRRMIQVSGISPGAYINEYRLNKALPFLQHGTMTVSEVAFEVGFNSASYFSTAFKKYYSISPKQVEIHPAKPATSDTMVVHSGPTPVFEIDSRPSDDKRILSSVAFLIVPISLVAILFGWELFSSRSERNSPLITKDKSLAVLPFQNYSNDQLLDVFCDGMTDELISKLSQLEDFDRVISRTSAFKFKDMQLTVSEIASELGVSFILEGNLQKTEEEIRINVQLIDAGTDDHVWTDQYTGEWEPDNIFNMQEEITSFVAGHMKVAISIDESERILAITRPNKDAYNRYLQAKFQMYGSDEESMKNARQMLEESIELDSTFSAAYTELGYIWLVGGLAEGIRNQNIAWQKAKYYLSKAQHLDHSPIKTEFHLLQGYFYFDWDFVRLEEFYHTKFTQYTYDRESCGLIDYAIKTGRFESALSVINNSIEADPLEASLVSFKARTLWFLGKKNEAMDLLMKLNRLNKNDWFYLREAAHTYYIMEEYDQSGRVLDLVMERFEDRSPLLIWLKLFYSHRHRNNAQVKALLDELEKAYRNGASGSPAWFLALYHLGVKRDVDAAFEWLERSYEANEVELTWLKQEPLLAPHRRDERYQSLYRRIGFDQLR
ncbi:MAG: helix-turn-helix domain-containing protein [Saprospiraceae bacterium]|nr:helix-turn-helix domain-containing protein [Saprospiraceae bacterium]